MTNKTDNKDLTSFSDSKGLLIIFEILESLFEYMLKCFKRREEDKDDIVLEILFKRIKEGKRLLKAGKNEILDIQRELSSLNNVLENVPLLESSFKKAQMGLKGASDVAEEATIQIQDSSIIIQDSLDKVHKYLNKLESMEKFDADARDILKSCINEISMVADTAFNIMTSLQFQDILRQQLSAIGMILSNTKMKIVKSLQKIEKMAVEVEKDEEVFVATDESILCQRSAQDEIDLLMSREREKDNVK
jgi:hypothetical protein